MALNLVSRSLPTPQLENALWEALVALQRHGLDNPQLLENTHYKTALKRAHDAWAIVFKALP
jgi:hypothetical protein